MFLLLVNQFQDKRKQNRQNRNQKTFVLLVLFVLVFFYRKGVQHEKNKTDTKGD